LRPYFKNEVTECLAKDENVRTTVLIVTRYSKTTHRKTIYKLYVNSCNKRVETVRIASQMPSNYYDYLHKEYGMPSL